MEKRPFLRGLGMLGAVALIFAPMAVATADEAEIAVSSTAWFWETQQSQAVTDPTTGADVITIEAPNPFCPTVGSAGGPPEEAGTCKAGRLPVEVVGSDYEEPDKLSAIGFDFALVPFGSEVTEFTVTFLEADDEQSQPVNVDDTRQLRACLVEEFFGDGDARQYKEVPRHSCTDSDPIADRKEAQVENADGEKEARFVWTFDLTVFAQQWAEGSPASAIILYPVQPEGAGPDDAEWRVVLSGPAEANGITSNLVYEPPAEDDFTDPTDPTDTGTDFTDTGTDFGTSTGTDFGTGTGTDPGTTTGPTDTASPVALDTGAEEAGATLPEVASLPGYVWLGILAGLIAFTLLRAVVIEAATGVRPDGVLSQIRKINSERRGVALEEILAAEQSSRFAPIAAGLRKLGSGPSKAASKIFRRKG